MATSLKNLQLADQYHNLVQVDSNVLYDGDGNAITPSFSNTRTFNILATKTQITTNSYLKIGENFSNINPYYVPFDGKLLSVALTTNGNFSWTFQVFKNGTVISAADLVITSASEGFIDLSAANINLVSGDLLSFYCNGSNITDINAYIIGTF